MTPKRKGNNKKLKTGNNLPKDIFLKKSKVVAFAFQCKQDETMKKLSLKFRILQNCHIFRTGSSQIKRFVYAVLKESLT